MCKIPKKKYIGTHIMCLEHNAHRFFQQAHFVFYKSNKFILYKSRYKRKNNYTCACCPYRLGQGFTVKKKIIYQEESRGRACDNNQKFHKLQNNPNEVRKQFIVNSKETAAQTICNPVRRRLLHGWFQPNIVLLCGLVWF